MFNRVKIRLSGGKAVKVTKTGAQELEKLFEFFTTEPGAIALGYFKTYCAAGVSKMEPGNPAVHTYRAGMEFPYKKLIEDIKLGAALANGQNEVRVIDPIQEDVYEHGSY